jgi:RimJ/RimL family protein N-acetyltransferase
MSPTLRTDRLILRPARVDDGPAIVRYLNNFAVAGNLARVPYPYAASDAEWWLSHQHPDPEPDQAGFGIELPGAGYIGNIGFHRDGARPVLGYWLAEPFWHRGLMTEAARAVVGWFFEATDQAFIRSGVFHFNRASLAVQKKLGFTEIGMSTMHCLARREDLRHIDTQLTRAQWKGPKP